MNKIKIGILGASDIAFRKFLPAIKSGENFEYVGFAIANIDERNAVYKQSDQAEFLKKSKSKVDKLMNEFGGERFNSYGMLLESKDIEAVYIPLPPSLHYYWAKKALENGKHVLLEKPFTTRLEDTKNLINIAKEKDLAVHENYAFCYHNQVNSIFKIIKDGSIGDIRLIRTAFGFPFRGANDFRYNKFLGGGALLDCGGYPIKLSTLLLGKTTHVTAATLNKDCNHEVDIFGSVTLQNDKGITSQVSFGMDNAYKCELEIWGSKGILYAPRIFTAPADIYPQIILRKDEDTVIKVKPKDQFLESANHFYECITDKSKRNTSYEEIELQATHIDEVMRI